MPVANSCCLRGNKIGRTPVSISVVLTGFTAGLQAGISPCADTGFVFEGLGLPSNVRRCIFVV